MDLDAFEGKYRILQNWFCCFAFHLRNECKIVFFFWAKVSHPTILTLRAFLFFRNLCYNIIESLILREKKYMILVEKEYEIPSKLQNKKNKTEKWRERERERMGFLSLDRKFTPVSKLNDRSNRNLFPSFRRTQHQYPFSNLRLS